MLKTFCTLIFCGFLSIALSQQHKQIELLVTAERTLAEGDSTEALNQFQKILQRYPQNYAAINRLAEIFYSQKKYRQSSQYIFLGIDIVERFLEQSNVELVRDKKHMTSLQYSKAKDLNGRYKRDLASLYHLLALNRSRQERYNEALVNYKEAIELHNSYPYLIDIALAYFNTNDYDQGVSSLHEAKAMKPENHKAYYNLANFYNQTDQYDSAIYYYKQTIELNDSLTYPHLYLAKIYTKQDKPTQAIRSLDNYIARDSTKVEPYFRRALLYTNQARFEQALQDWMKVLEMEPENVDAVKNRGLTYFFLEKYEEAIQDFNVSLESNQDPYSLLNRGYSHYLINESEKGIEDLNKALPALPNYALGYYIRALINYDLKNRAIACEDLKKALELGFDESEVEKKLMRKCF